MLDYIALGILIFAFITLFYGIIVIHDIPYEIAVHRNHPHQDAIHYAGWVSLFTLHALWPFLWIWSTLYREDRGWGFQPTEAGTGAAADSDTSATDEAMTEADLGLAQPAAVSPAALALVQHRLEALDDRIARIEQAILAATETSSSEGVAD